MKKLFNLCLFGILAVGAASLLADENVSYDSVITHEQSNWEKIPDVAQYKMADWSQLVGIARRVTVEEAQKIAESDPQIAYFFYVKGLQLVLENDEMPPTLYRVFRHGDAVFFTGTPWWGSAPDLADGYVKQ